MQTRPTSAVYALLLALMVLLGLPWVGATQETAEQRARALVGLTTQLNEAQIQEARLNADTVPLQTFRATGLALASKLSQQQRARTSVNLTPQDLQSQALERYIARDLSLSLDAAIEQLEPLDALRLRVRSLNDAVESLRSALVMEGTASAGTVTAGSAATSLLDPTLGALALPEGVYTQRQNDFRAFPTLDVAKAQKPLLMPVKQADVLRGFGEEDPGDPAGVFLKGAQLTAPAAATVFAPFEGKIVYAAPYRSFGNLVVIEHEGEGATLVAGLHSFAISVGEWVRQGAPLGLMAAGSNSGDATQVNRLYFEFRVNQQPVDPLALVGMKTNE